MRVEWESLAAMKPAEAAELLVTQRENQWFERKSIRSGVDVFARALVGLANAEGGLIVVGVSDREVEDLRGAEAKLNDLRRSPQTHCAPPPKVTFHELALLVDGQERPVLIAVIPPGGTLHETTAGECYLRTGDSTVRLTASQREELAYDRGAAQYEARPVQGVLVEGLDAGSLASLRDALRSSLPDEGMLRARSLLTHDGQVTVAGYLLLAPSPQELMPHAHVRLLRFLTSDPGSGSRQTLAEGGDVRIEGSIPDVIERAAALIEEWVPRRHALRADGRFGPVPVIPRDAWLEGLVNAVVHRSYSMVGDHIRVSLFPDRIQIESPGRFPGIVDLVRPTDISRYARNPRIARVCNDLGITQERGEGIRRIFEEMASYGLLEPSYHQTAGSVRLTLFAASRIAPSVAARLPAGAEAALRVLRETRRPMGTGEISEAIGLARPATIKALKALQILDEVKWRGNSPKDPRATWILPELH